MSKGAEDTEDGTTVSFKLSYIEVKKVDFSVLFGTGLDFSIAPNTSLLVDLTYNLGLSNLDDSGSGDDVKNRVFSILAGLSFNLGG